MTIFMCPDCEGFGLKEQSYGGYSACRMCVGLGLKEIRQSRRMSAVEVITGTAIGFVVALVTTHFVMPWFGHPVTVAENFGITAIFTVVSVIRGYCVRRLFEACR